MISAMRWTIRLSALALITLGALFWSGIAVSLVGIHMLLGLVLVLTFWSLAFLASRAGAPAGMVIAAFVLGLLVIGLGVSQDRILLGDAHWIVRVVHLLLGLAAAGFAERLGRLAAGSPVQSAVVG